MTQRGSRSMQKQMPPRYCARCSTASRRRRGPDGPSISQFDPFGKYSIGQRLAEQLVVDAEVVAVDARLRNAGRAAGLEDVDRLAGEPLRHPALHRSAAQPLVLERAESPKIGERPDLAAWIPPERACASAARTGSPLRDRNASRRSRVPMRRAPRGSLRTDRQKQTRSIQPA